MRSEPFSVQLHASTAQSANHFLLQEIKCFIIFDPDIEGIWCLAAKSIKRLEFHVELRQMKVLKGVMYLFDQFIRLLVQKASVR